MRTGHSLTPGFYDQVLTEALGQDLAELQLEELKRRMKEDG